MSTQVLSSVISALATILTIAISIGVYKQRLDDLAKKVDKHNNVIERVFRLEENVNHRDIGALESDVRHCQEDIKELKKICQKK